MMKQTNILTLLGRFFAAEDSDPEDRSLKNEGCFICTNLAMADDEAAMMLLDEKLGLIRYVVNILETMDATYAQVENALWVLYNLSSEYSCVIELIQLYSIIDLEWKCFQLDPALEYIRVCGPFSRISSTYLIFVYFGTPAHHKGL